MRSLAAAFVALGIAAPALAAEPDGCDKFKWPIDGDRAALIAADRAPMTSGASLVPGPKAVTLGLAPLETAALPKSPERSRGGFAGYLEIAAPGKPSSYTVSTSSAVWIDVIQNGDYVKPAAVSGAKGCEGIRKSIRFDLAAGSFMIQVSGSTDASIALVARPSD